MKPKLRIVERCTNDTDEKHKRKIVLTLKVSAVELEYIKSVSDGNLSDYIRKKVLGSERRENL